MIQTDNNTMEAKEEHIALETKIADLIEDASEDIEKGCCRHVNIIFWFKKISQIFTLFSALWMFGI